MDRYQRAPDLGVVERGKPALPRLGRAVQPRADRLDDQDIGEPRQHRFPARPQTRGFARDIAQGAVHTAIGFLIPPLMKNHRRQLRQHTLSDLAVKAHNAVGDPRQIARNRCVAGSHNAR